MKIETDPTFAAVAVADLQKSQQNNPSSSNKEATSAKSEAPVADHVSISVQIPRKTLETLQQFGQVGDFLNNLATNLRKTKEGLKTSDEILDKMKAPLDRIIKQYPPFNSDDRERMELLMSYSSLREQIKSLIVPAPPPPVYEKVQHLWQNLFADKDGTIPAPQLPVDAPDSHVKVAAAQLDSFTSQITVIRDELQNSIKAI